MAGFVGKPPQKVGRKSTSLSILYLVLLGPIGSQQFILDVPFRTVVRGPGVCSQKATRSIFVVLVAPAALAVLDLK